MHAHPWLSDIRRELEIALDSEEEYLEEGAMGTYYPKSYATAAAERLDSLWRPFGPTDAAVIQCCVEALADPERIRKGRSKQLLLQLRERSRPILDALANATNPQLRIFALETAHTSMSGSYFNPLYGSITLAQRLLNDPDEHVRLVAIACAQQTIAHNAKFIQTSLQKGIDTAMTGLFRQVLARLDDPSAQVRTAAAAAVGVWAAQVGHEALDVLLEHEQGVEARKALAMTRVL